MSLWHLVQKSLIRPNSTFTTIVISIGAGLSILVAVNLIERNLNYQISDTLPKTAPTFFFIDIQPDQILEFDKIISSIANI